MNLLITGGSGLLGHHLSLIGDRPTHSQLDITHKIKPKKYDLIIHCAGYTKVEQAEIDKLECFDVNVRGTLNLLNAYPDTPFVYISSEYANRPVNFYSLTKSLAEQLVTEHPHYLIIRTLFKARPWKYPKAFVDQWTLGDYVDVIAPRIEDAIKTWGEGFKYKSKMAYVGTGRKLIFNLARQSRPDVQPMSIKEIKTVKLPSDYA